MALRPELVRTAGVAPPAFDGKVRLIRVAGVDVQPCGGTHVRDTREIGAIRVQKIEKKSRHNRRVTVLAVSPDGGSLATAGEDHAVQVWDTVGGGHVRTLTGHTDRIPALAWHPQEKWLVSAGWDTTARVWNAERGEPIILLNSHSDQVNLAAFSPDGKVLSCADL